MIFRDHKFSNELSYVIKVGKPTLTCLRYLPGNKRTYRSIYWRYGLHSLVDHVKLPLNDDDEKIKIKIYHRDRKVAEHGVHVTELYEE